jgi:hypothetical protein
MSKHFDENACIGFLHCDRGHQAVPIAAGRGPSPGHLWRGVGAGSAVLNHSYRSPPWGRLVRGIVRIRATWGSAPMAITSWFCLVSALARILLFGQASCRRCEDTPKRRFEALWGAFRGRHPIVPFALVSFSAPLVSCISLVSPGQHSVSHARPTVRQEITLFDILCRNLRTSVGAR